MSTDTTDDDFDELRGPDEWREGDEVTCVHSGTTVAWGAPLMGSSHHVLARGQVLVVDAGTLEHRADLLSLIADEQRQVERWGQVRLVRGAVEIEPWDAVGDAIWILERDRAREIANQQIDPRDRLRMHAEIKARFGAAPTPRSTNQYRDIAAERRLADDRYARSQQPREVNVSRAD
jgi:hypothetical protein